MKVKLTLSAAAKRIRALEHERNTAVQGMHAMNKRIRALERDRALLLEITYKGAALPVVRAAMRWYACDVQGKQTRARWYSSEAGPLSVACARLERARERERKR